ncbi:hypothetical protein HA402_006956 [Bradysia odoriphaga]|nr:hypothetical protein HA402_006956 [Bradysia odoriphaga]
MAAIIAHLLRRAPILYPSRVVVSNYRRSHQIESNVSSLPNTERLSENTTERSNAKPVNLTKLMEYLSLDASNLQRVNYKLLHNVINSAVKEYVSPSEGAFLLECCTMLPDMNKQDKSKLIDTIWNEGILKSGQPSKEQIIALLRAYKVIGRAIDDFNAFLTQHNCDGDVELYEEFLHLVCENGTDCDGIVKVLSDIKDRGFPLTENLFNALILGHSQNKSVENCEKVLETMVTANLPPSSETYMYLLRAYIENGDVTKATKILSEHGGTFSQEQSFLIIRTAAVNDCVELVRKAMQLLPADSLLNKNVVPGLRNICTELINMDKVEAAYSIIDNLPKIKFTDGESTDSFGMFFINEMVRHNDDWRKIIQIAQRLVDSDRNKRAVHCCCELMLRANSPNSLDCIKYLNGIEPLLPHYFWPIILQQYRVTGETGILNVLKEMKDLNVPVDEETLVHYVLPKLKITMKNAKQGLKTLSDEGVPINVLLTPVLCQLLHQSEVNEALRILKAHKTKVDGDQLLGFLISTVRKFDAKSPITAFAQLVHTIRARLQKDDCDLAGRILIESVARSGRTIDASVFVSLLNEFQAIGIKIPTVTYDQLLVHVQNNLPVEFHKKTKVLLQKMLDKTIETQPAQIGMGKHPRDMTVEELECHLIELQSKNLNSRGVLRRLLQQLVRTGKNDRALEVHQLCKENKVECSPGMLASVLDLMIHTKNLSEAENTFNQLKKMHPSFPIDEFKVIDLASLMIENERIDAAREILQARAKSNLKGGTHCHKNIWALLYKCSGGQCEKRFNS